MIINPYKIVTLETKISIYAYQLDENIDNAILNNLIKKVKGKNYEHYYVIDVIEIVNYNDLTYNGQIYIDDQLCLPVYKVKYNAKICMPQMNVEILGKFQAFQAGYMHFKNGPLDIIVTNKYNTSKFKINNDELYVGDKVVTHDTICKLEILNHLIFNGQKEIVCIGALNDIASNDEINEYGENIRENIIDY